MSVALFFLSYFEGWLCYKYVSSYVMGNSKLKKSNRYIIKVIITFIAIISTINRKLVFFSHTLFLVTLIISIITAWCIYKKKKSTLLLSISIYYSLVALLDFFFAYLCMEFMVDDFTDIIFWNSQSWWTIVILGLSRIIMFLVYYFLSFENFDLEEMKTEVCITAIVLLCILRFYQTNMGEMVLGEQSWAGMHMGVSLLVLLVVVIIGLLLTVKNKMIQRENGYLLMRDEMLMNTYRRIEEEIEQNRIWMHDIKHEYILLNEYAKKEDIENIRKYLEKNLETFDSRKTDVWTQERIWDSIILQKKEEAERKGIKVNIRTMMISEFPFNEREGCSIFGNLLDNAIEACEKILDDKREININIHRHQCFTFIEVSNTTNMSLKYKNGNLDTTKGNRKLHGYGLKSVKRIIDKYDAEMEYHENDNIFTIRLSFFDIEKGKENIYGRKNDN